MGAGSCAACLGRDAEDEQHPKPVWTSAKESARGASRVESHYVLDRTCNVKDDYTLERPALGSGTFGAVYRARDKTSGAIRAIKAISVTKIPDGERFQVELQLMAKLAHPNIIKLYESYRDPAMVYLVMELCAGGELFDKILEASMFSERQAAILLRQILGAILYMHGENVCHRDIKPENFLFVNKHPIESNVLKIIDFGLSCEVAPGNFLKTKAGTAYYIAPQVLEGRYDKACDLWSCGVLMYIFLCGYPPFSGGNDAEILAEVMTGKVYFEPKDWKHISEDAKNLITGLLTKDASMRLSAQAAMNHVWVREMAPKSNNVCLQSNIVDQLRTFRGVNKLKKAALQIIARQLSDGNIDALRQVFLAIDENGDGTLSLTELKEGMKRIPDLQVPADFEEILKGIDSDGSGAIDYNEFLASTLSYKQYCQEDVCWAAFRVFDVDGDGKITPDELKQVLSSDSLQQSMADSGQNILDLMKEVDTDGNGSIDFNEFMEMMRGNRKKSASF